MRILSLFDGISCARVALEKVGIPIDVYYSSEIDKYAITIAQKNYPDTIQLGDVRNVNSITDIDLMIGGSPCQDLSIAKKDRKGLKGKRSELFWEFVRILEKIKPKYFVLENVASMNKENEDIISKALGVKPIMIDATLVSAQRRKRLFWTNISDIKLPEDKGIFLQDILQLNHDFHGVYSNYYNKIIKTKAYTTGIGCRVARPVMIAKIGKGGQGDRVYSIVGKSVALSANGGGRGAKTGLYVVNDFVRKLTPIECERLQCLPDNYTEGISNTQRYKCLGNAFNVDVVAHILKSIVSL
jgi:DNA (cytosine-5)-methyltransferase 3A